MQVRLLTNRIETGNTMGTMTERERGEVGENEESGFSMITAPINSKLTKRRIDLKEQSIEEIQGVLREMGIKNLLFFPDVSYDRYIRRNGNIALTEKYHGLINSLWKKTRRNRRALRIDQIALKNEPENEDQFEVHFEGETSSVVRGMSLFRVVLYNEPKELVVWGIHKTLFPQPASQGPACPYHHGNPLVDYWANKNQEAK
ncbi:MAG: hypothetical protein JWN37_556 [Candidatus Nomurabacteria bacterium]|nr:hypothetical protein [Candidatus Nomurabacteria bacterium]